MIEQSEDFQLGGIVTYTPACSLKLIYTSEADAYWALLDVTSRWGGIAARFPGLRLMTTFTKQDHVQSQDDHPHVRQVLDGAAAQSLWYRLNADASYFAAENGTLPAGYVETPANVPVPAGDMKAHAEPIGTNNDAMQVAGHAEMADRTYRGCWWPELNGTIRPAAVPESEAAALSFSAEGGQGVFHYDVKPNGIHGRYGADSGGRPRLDAGRACEE